MRDYTLKEDVNIVVVMMLTSSFYDVNFLYVRC